jgi:hypothetical protein
MEMKVVNEEKQDRKYEQPTNHVRDMTSTHKILDGHGNDEEEKGGGGGGHGISSDHPTS